MFEKILVPLDGSDLSQGILPYVTQLAKGAGSSLVLLSVIDISDLEDHLRAQNVSDEMLSNAESHAKTWLDGVAEGLRRDGIDVLSVVAPGKPADTIAKVAGNQGCDLIAMSTHGRNVIVRGILGSVTDRVMHTSSMPVLTITPDRAAAYGDGRDSLTEVIVALDGSERSESVLPYVEDIASKLSLKVMLVRVISVVSTAFLADHPFEGYTNVQADLEKECKQYLQDHAARLTDKGLEVDWKLMKGAPAIQILDLAHQRPHNLVVLASHGRSGINRMILGSVTEKLIRASNDPILVVPDQAG